MPRVFVGEALRLNGVHHPSRRDPRRPVHPWEGCGVRPLSHLPLFWNVSLDQRGGVLLGTLVLVLSPAERLRRGSSPPRWSCSRSGWPIMLLTNALLLRRSLAPLDRVIRAMEAMDQLQPGVLPEAARARCAASRAASTAARPARGERSGQRRQGARGPGGRAAPDRPGAARRGRPEPDGRTAGAQAGRATGAGRRCVPELALVRETARDRPGRRTPRGPAAAAGRARGPRPAQRPGRAGHRLLDATPRVRTPQLRARACRPVAGGGAGGLPGRPGGADQRRPARRGHQRRALALRGRATTWC